ncbi:hypothetical protein WALSEDRAFT_59632 [Wallemia mellicola CBS 633.66]|uniref:C2 domain-containing protein n=1 Tax=Wallemia mellicola (strain ATCC MYA-4683 / CBS 633.66) TaxID=671144 RepID=I4YFS3_WALMC|nr:hypothetical protein WALSEDRAFT_59632 [Wallemia mellicola CBS 633.66]EIM22815.1 hypothetical protein WALSEDRAFT_59632 [Wallemia mellicola CBS 633.66]|eukprot:XP_006956868.1 hypothetical protein WALSEDRAFT_59632 [Wallemia mellicola CBS 633.66]
MNEDGDDVVLDPITLHNVEAKDTTKEEYDYVMRRLSGKANIADDNFISKPFPPTHSSQEFIRENFPTILKEFGIYTAILSIIPLPIPLIIALTACLLWRIWWHLDNEADKLVYEQERQRVLNSKASIGGIQESCNWMNQILSRVWGIINPDLFTLGIDLLEDTMESMLPSFMAGFVNGVKVSDMDQGTVPMRVLSMRDLTDAEMMETLNNNDEEKESDSRARPDEESGEYVNLEINFAYRAKPSGSLASKSRNIHMLIHFVVGLKKMLGAVMPVYVEVQGMTGTLRARCQLIPDPPFIKNTTIAFMGLPKVVISATPLTKHFLNAMKLPLVSQFINSSINAAMRDFCAPKSYTVDVQDLLLEDDVKRDATAIGVIDIRIHGAHDIEKSDTNGTSDPYCTISFSKEQKPVYSTRVIVNDLYPTWEESTTILLRPEIIKSQEDIIVQLYDSDRFSADDRLGAATMSITKLVRHPGKVYRLNSELAGQVHGTKRQGTLSWSVSFHPKRDLNKSLLTPGTHPGVPEDIAKKYKDEFGDHKLENENRLVQRIKPEPDFPSGILSFQIHSISQLEVKKITGSFGTDSMRSGVAGQSYMETEDEESSAAPSSYCIVIVNDQTVYRTRKKPFAFNPVFNAGTEKFIADWRSTVVCVVVYDSRYREEDPILGVIPLKLSDILRNGCQLTNSYPLIGGLGYGRIRLSILFRSSDMKLERPLLGWEIGTVQLHSNVVVKFNEGMHVNYNRCIIRTISSEVKLNKRKTTAVDTVAWKIETDEPPMRLPVKRRYASSFRLEFYTNSRVGNTPAAVAIIWLRDVVDNEMLRNFRMSLWEGKDFHRLMQCYTYTEEDAERLNLKKIGYVELDIRYKSGLGKTHSHFKGNKESMDVLQAWEAAVSSGQRSTVGDFINEYTDVDRNRDPARAVIGGADNSSHRTSHRYSTDGYSVGTLGTFGEMSGRMSGRMSGDFGEYETDHEEDGELNKHARHNNKSSKKAIRKAMHREHRGSYQYKPIRTALWAAKGMRHTASNIRAKASLHDRRADQVETEV